MLYFKCYFSYLSMKPEIFKAYDIRGIYPTEINEDDAYDIGRAVVEYLRPKCLGIGRDIRDLGIITTPMVYFAAGRLDIDAAISLTASHNPPQYNGMKLALRGAIPVGENTGLQEIRDLALRAEWAPVEQKGSLQKEDIRHAYYGYFASFANFKDKKFKIVIDTANAMGVLELP